MTAVAYPVREQWVAPRSECPARRPDGSDRRERLNRLDARVYRRRRVVTLFMLVAVALVAVAAIWLTLAGPGGGALTTPGSSGAESPLSGRVYVVRTGDSLWSIVQATGRGGDPRPDVDRLARQLQGGSLRPGQRLLIP